MVVQLKIIALLALLISLAGCKSPADKELRSSGETAFRSNCQTCHSLPKPGMKTDEEWPALVSRYGERAKLSREKIDDIVIYLLANN
jgi:mono/diheme cytochrome c family protein